MQSRFFTSQLTIFTRATVIVFILFASLSLMVSTVFAFETSPSSPSTASTPGKSWTNISYSFASDNLYALAKKSNKQLKLSNFTIPGIPGGATIDGITVTVEGFTAGLQANVALSYDGGTSYTSALTTVLTATEAVNTLGGPTNTWGRTWIPSDFTNNKFMVKLTTTGGSGTGITISVDQVQVKVYYTPPSTTLSLSPVSGPYGGTASMTATLTLTADSTPIPSKTINFYVGGTGIDASGNCTGDFVGSATTQAGTGVATLASASLVGIGAGEYPYGACASFAGDATYQATSLTNHLSVVGTGTTLTASPATATYGGTVDLSATLTLTSGGTPINNQWITFYLFGNSLGSSKTNNSGVATLSNTSLVGYNAGASNDISVTFDGDANLNPANSSALITINTRPISVTAVNDTKVYDGTASSTGIPNITSGSLVTGDVASFIQTFNTQNAGTGKTITPSGTVDDGNSGLNYSVTFVPVTTGVINKAPLTVTANDQSRLAGTADPVFTFNYSGLIVGETSTVIDVVPTCTVSTPHTAVGTYPITCSGGSDNNYSFSYVNGTLTVGNTAVYIGGGFKGSYIVPLHENTRKSYPGVDNGPVKVTSITGMPIVASERVAYSPDGGTTWTSHSELMGLPSNMVHTSYTFPWYNNLDLNSQLRFGNVGNANTTVTVTIGGQFKGNYTLAPNASQRVNYPGLDKGPVVITSNGQPIIASLRVAYTPDAGVTWTSFSEMMGLPSNKLTNSYTFPWYNNLTLDSQLRFGNVGTAPTNVTVTIAGQVKGTYTLQPNESKRIKYADLDKGPVKVTSSGNVPIIASLRVAYHNGTAWTDFSEMMGLPSSSLSTHYSFPVYDNVTYNSQLRFGNVGTSTTNVTVTINGVVQGTYTLNPNQSRRISYPLNSGPVVIQSSGGVPIIASLRVAYTPDGGVTWTSFAEMMGLPQAQLTTSYYFPWYNDLTLDTQLRFAVP